MPVDFFNTNCKEAPINDSLFGICDNEDGRKAFTNKTNKDIWIAKVKNDKNIIVLFTAIDNCIDILRENGNMDNRCDGMLSYDNNIVFIELKNQRLSWISDAVKQLETTIEHFKSNHNLNAYKHKRAFVSNKKHPHFHVIDTEMKQLFYNKFKVRLNVNATIEIK